MNLNSNPFKVENITDPKIRVNKKREEIENLENLSGIYCSENQTSKINFTDNIIKSPKIKSASNNIFGQSHKLNKKNNTTASLFKKTKKKINLKTNSNNNNFNSNYNIDEIKKIPLKNYYNIGYKSNSFISKKSSNKGTSRTNSDFNNNKNGYNSNPNLNRNILNEKSKTFIEIHNNKGNKNNYNKNTTPQKNSNSNSSQKPSNKSLLANDQGFSKLNVKEKSFYLLAHSPVLRLSERIIFSKCSKNLKSIISIPELLKNNAEFLNEKVKELVKKLSICDENIANKFKASKISEITLNFLVSSEEEEFKKFVIFNEDENSQKNYYLYLKVLFLLFNENYDGINDKMLKNVLYDRIKAKGFQSIKDYLYQMYIKNTIDSHILENIDAINEILEENPKILNFNYFLRCTRFISFTTYVINEIIAYANDMKNNILLKIETQKYLGSVQNKLNYYYSKYGKL